MRFGYFPDFDQSNFLADWYLRIIGYPFGSRRNEVSQVFKQVDPHPHQTILDVGCGDGIWTNYLAASSGANIVGLDVSKRDLSVAKTRAAKTNASTKYVLADATKMPFADQTFNTVFSISTLEHTSDDQAILNEIYRVLKPGGKLVISLPTTKILPVVPWLLKLPFRLRGWLQSSLRDADSLKDYIKRVNTRFAHQRLYTKKKVAKKLQLAGFPSATYRYHISFFGIIPHSLVHTISIFEWKKTKTSAYSFFNQVVFALTFPFFYPWYLLDNFFPQKKGFVIFATAYKPALPNTNKT